MTKETSEEVLYMIVIVLSVPFMFLYYVGKGFWHGMKYTWDEFKLWVVFAWSIIKS